MAWAAVSKYPKERGTAAARFRAYTWRIEPDVLLYALMDVALAGYHARMFNEQVARERVARIREVLREEEKAEERNGAVVRRRGRLRPIADILRSA
jgi:hypothetical protein